LMPQSKTITATSRSLASAKTTERTTQLLSTSSRGCNITLAESLKLRAYYNSPHMNTKSAPHPANGPILMPRIILPRVRSLTFEWQKVISSIHRIRMSYIMTGVPCHLKLHTASFVHTATTISYSYSYSREVLGSPAMELTMVHHFPLAHAKHNSMQTHSS